MSAGEILLDYTNLFSPNYYQKNDKIIYKNFKDKYDKKKKKKIDETDKEKDNVLMSEKHTRVCRASIYFEYFLFSCF